MWRTSQPTTKGIWGKKQVKSSHSPEKNEHSSQNSQEIWVVAATGDMIIGEEISKLISETSLWGVEGLQTHQMSELRFPFQGGRLRRFSAHHQISISIRSLPSPSSDLQHLHHRISNISTISIISTIRSPVPLSLEVQRRTKMHCNGKIALRWVKSDDLMKKNSASSKCDLMWNGAASQQVGPGKKNAPRLSISIVIWILSSDTICQLNQFNTNSEAAMLSSPGKQNAPHTKPRSPVLL